MPDLKASQTRALHYLPQLELVVIGLLSALVQLLFRAPTSRWVPALWFESIFLLAIPPLALWVASKWLPRRFSQASRKWDSLPAVHWSFLHVS